VVANITADAGALGSSLNDSQHLALMQWHTLSTEKDRQIVGCITA
jgi:hypothetical protein